MRAADVYVTMPSSECQDGGHAAHLPDCAIKGALKQAAIFEDVHDIAKGRKINEDQRSRSTKAAG